MKKVGKLYYHEALHTTHVLLCTFDEHVLNSYAVDRNPDLKELAEEISTSMAKLYQAIGNKY